MAKQRSQLQVSCPSEALLLGSLSLPVRLGLPMLLCFGHKEAAHASLRLRLGPSKVPRPGVDLVNMAPRGHGSRASTIGTVTAAFKRVLLSDAVLRWNS